MGKIKIISNNPAKVYINEKNFGVVKKEIKEYELEKGEYEIYTKSAWCRSQKVKVSLQEDELVTFTLNSFKYESLTKSVFMLFVLFFMITKEVVFLGIAGIIILYPLYYLTIGSDKYLELELKAEKSDQLCADK